MIRTIFAFSEGLYYCSSFRHFKISEKSVRHIKRLVLMYTLSCANNQIDPIMHDHPRSTYRPLLAKNPSQCHSSLAYVIRRHSHCWLRSTILIYARKNHNSFRGWSNSTTKTKLGNIMNIYTPFNVNFVQIDQPRKLL